MQKPTKPSSVDKILKFKFRLAFVFWVLGITILSLTKLESDMPSEVSFIGFDKVVHVLFYFGFTFLLSLGFMEYKRVALSVKQLILIGILAASYGLFIEYLQQELTTSRQAEFYDILANLTGTLFAVLFLKYTSWYYRHLN